MDEGQRARFEGKQCEQCEGESFRRGTLWHTGGDGFQCTGPERHDWLFDQQTQELRHIPKTILPIKVEPTWILALFAEDGVTSLDLGELVRLAEEKKPEDMRRLREQEHAGGASLSSEFQDLVECGLIEWVNAAAPEHERRYRLSPSGKEAAETYKRGIVN